MTRGHDTDAYARYRPGGEPGEQRRDAAVETGAQDPGPSVTASRHRLRVAGLVAAAAGVAAVVAAAAFIVAGPYLRAPDAAGSTGGGTLASLIGSSTPSPIAGPITPTAFPYDDLAILRRQRLSTDVLPAGTFRAAGATDTPIVADVAVCLLLDEPASGGLTSGCGGASAAGGVSIEAGDSGSGGTFALVNDGGGRSCVRAPAGSQRLAPNVWVSPPSK
ncbi:hypothetical protein AX769_01175 [Frondihabitans sp. PAMC 28766]|uniref:hypothetical protein n=1 Tax=Frondihabitans sp. PAMC 28766 TaxID=1795630 RepID=UPI00078DB791|nr:hypothetical protein [Frondihabitans sp. PAMC 28766]AMM19006.1 hypothetical protein AX769_01175 [Frondihabitans sp. PAMC 28766]